MNKPNVYLADLRYNYSGVLANDCMPLGVAYMKAVMDHDGLDIKSRLFAYPDRLLEAMTENPPDVLMVSNYVWNEALSLHLARLGKRINPRMLVVMGGPNISIEPERQIHAFRGLEIDRHRAPAAVQDGRERLRPGKGRTVDAHDLGSEVGEDHPAERHGPDSPELHHVKPHEWPGANVRLVGCGHPWPILTRDRRPSALV